MHLFLFGEDVTEEVILYCFLEKTLCMQEIKSCLKGNL